MFPLMWANHDRKDQFCPKFDKERTIWLPSRHSPRDLERVVDYCVEHYFRQPNYWQVEGRLFFSIFQPMKFVEQLSGPREAAKLLRKMDDRLRQAGLPPMHCSGMVADPKSAAILQEAGFRSTSRYNANTAGRAGPDLTEQYEHLMQAHRDPSPEVIVDHGWSKEHDVASWGFQNLRQGNLAVKEHVVDLVQTPPLERCCKPAGIEHRNTILACGLWNGVQRDEVDHVGTVDVGDEDSVSLNCRSDESHQPVHMLWGEGRHDEPWG